MNTISKVGGALSRIASTAVILMVSLAFLVAPAFAQGEMGIVQKSGGGFPTAANLRIFCYVTTATNPDTDDWIIIEKGALGIAYNQATGGYTIQEDNFNNDDIALSGDNFYIRFEDGSERGSDNALITVAASQNLGTTVITGLSTPTPPAIVGYPGDGKVLLTGILATGSTSSRVYRGKVYTSAKFQRLSSNTLIASYVDSGLTNGVAQSYTIIPNDAGTFAYGHSNVVIVTPDATAPNIVSITPSPQNRNANITISGTGFGASGTVYMIDVNGLMIVAPQVGGWTATSVTVTIPGTAKLGVCPVYLVNNLNQFDDGSVTVTGPVVPTVTSVVKNYGYSTARPVAITGTGFTGATLVSFDAVSLTPFTINNDNSISVTIPAAQSVGVHNITVTNANGTSVTGAGSQYTVVGLPIVTIIAPTSGPTPNTITTLTGTNLYGDATDPVTVNINGTSVTFTASLNNTTITNIAVPSGLVVGNTYDVTVTNPVGTSSIVAGDKYTVTGNLPPNSPTGLQQYKADGTTVIAQGAWTNENTVVLKMSMTDGNTSDTLTPQAEVVINPAGFSGTPNNTGTGVAYSGSAVIGSITVSGLVTNTSYNWQGRVRDAALATSAPVDFNATKPSFRVDTTAPVVAPPTVPAGGASGVAATPTISVAFTEIASGINPATVIAANFTVSGSVSGVHTTAPTGTTTVTFNQVGAFTPGETVTCTVTTGLRDLAGNALASPYSWTFTVLSTTPTVTNVNPVSGLNTGTTPITITGTNFTSVNWVHLGTTNLPGFVVDSPTQISVTVPSGLTAGTYDITVNTATGTSPINSPADRFTVTNPGPTPSSNFQMIIWPNPYNPNTGNLNFTFQGANPGDTVEIYIMDTNTRVIWHTKSDLSPDTIQWDGFSQWGEMADNGLYLVRVLKGNQSARGKILVVKK